MCRIAGIINPSVDISDTRNKVGLMCMKMKHGGPDGEGIYVNKQLNLVFGHRRLALLDLSEAGKQPMSFADERYVITYNGEIYNYPELKKELEQKGHHFKTVCDTEMILIAFSEWGIDAFAKFEGMFAFAIVDNLLSKLYLARDPSGIKPLYYHHAQRKVIFASEVKAFGCIEENFQTEERARILLLAYGHIPEPFTTLKEVSMLSKGCCYAIDLVMGTGISTVFKKYTYSEKINDRKTAIEKIRNLTTKSVADHLLSDAPIGAFLSGGIDSSLVALLAHKHTGDHLNTLSLYFNEKDYSEKEFQDIIIAAANCKHDQYLLTGEEFSEQFEDVVESMDLPSIDGVNTWFISKCAKASGLKAVLSGLGSDEIFGGYPSFRRMKFIDTLRKLPIFFNSAVLKFFGNKFKRLEYLKINGIKGVYLFLRGIFLPKEIATILKIDEKMVWSTLKEIPILEENSRLSWFNKASWMELNMYMQNQLLRDSDVMSMAHGIEIRVPFLGDELLTNTLQISSGQKSRGKYPKQLLIDSFIDILPIKIWDRPKMGFAFPFRTWLRNNEFVKTLLVDKHPDAYKKFHEGNMPWGHIMALIVLEKKLSG